ncbi:MAG: hypothetical protein IKD08_01540 [Alphaproteobacteria bacterium]|nr:hypothetical protein [Alphaproteobacteria bacterium]
MAARLPKSLKALKKQLLKTLPERIAGVIADYEEFASLQTPEDAKGFAAHHAACKAAIAHVELLLKLAKWSEEENSGESGEDLSALIAKARAALDTMDEDEEEK